MRIAAVGDIHFTGASRGTLAPYYLRLADEADVLLLAGDITCLGRLDEAEAFLAELADPGVPVFAVLGNHDYDQNAAAELIALLQRRGMRVLDGTAAVVRVGGRTLGIAGVKGFCGGYEPYGLAPFGERELKDFVLQSVREAEKLDAALAGLEADVRVVLTHYAPIRETLGDEPPEIYPFLGSSRLVRPIDRAHVHAVFHGHAHLGQSEGRTPAGIPVYNVAMPVIRKPYRVVTVEPVAAAVR